MAKVFVSRKIPFWDELSKPLLDAGHEVVVYPNHKPITREELETEVEKGYDGLLILLTEKIDEGLLAHDKDGRLKFISNYAVGFDNIDVPACQKRNIIVSNTPSDEVNESVAEFAWSLMLSLTRRLPEAGEFMRNAAYRGWDPDIFMGRDMKGKVLGIVGMGRIGGMTARRAEGFGMKIIYYNRKPAEGMNYEYKGNLDDLLKEADYISLHVPLTAETRHLINGKNLPLFKKTAILVNTARGPVVDEHEVGEALRAGFIAGYGADVFENEPDPHPELLLMENVLLTPHIASATVEARRKMGELAVVNLMEGLAGRIPPNAIKS